MAFVSINKLSLNLFYLSQAYIFGTLARIELKVEKVGKTRPKRLQPRLVFFDGIGLTSNLKFDSIPDGTRTIVHDILKRNQKRCYFYHRHCSQYQEQLH
jgi:hypothetical protein